VSRTGSGETKQAAVNDEYAQAHLVLTTYREDPGRHELCCRSLESLAEHTQTPSILWLMDEGCGPPLPDVRAILSGSQISIGAVCVSGGRIGQAGQFNRGYALAEDAVRQARWPHRTYLVKLEDDFEYTPLWLNKLISVWLSPDFPDYNIGMLGGANGERGPVVTIAGHPVRLTFHVAAGCMFAPLAAWRQLDVPVPNRGLRDAQGGPTPTSSVVDWFVTRRATHSLAMLGKRAGLLPGLLKHQGGGQSTWRKQ